MNPCELWTQPEVLEMLDRTGWPVMEDFVRTELHFMRPSQFVAVVCGPGRVADALRDSMKYPMNSVADRVALAVLRDDSRQRLEKAGMGFLVNGNGRYRLDWPQRMIGEPPNDALHLGWHEDFNDFDTMLIAGRKAIP